MQTLASFDHSLHPASDFDKITQGWVHVVLSMSGSGAQLYTDGDAVQSYGRSGGIGCGNSHGRNVACVPDELTSTLVGDTFTGDSFHALVIKFSTMSWTMTMTL